MRRRHAAALAAALALVPACQRSPSPSPDGEPGAAPIDPIAPLHVFEEARRHATDFARLPPSDHALGPDPIALRALPPAGPARFAGLLRGRDAVVLLDASLHEIARAPAPALPTGLAVTPEGELLVTGEQSPVLARYRVRGATLAALPGVDLAAHTRGLRDVAAGSGRLAYAVDEREGRLFAVPLDGRGEVSAVVAGAGAFRVVRAGEQLVVDALLDHALLVFDLDARSVPRAPPRATVRHDGPMWGVDAVSTPEGLLIAAGGVEDHPLDRTEGSFGFIDSFVYLYLLPRGGDLTRLAAVNVSGHGVITPKALSIAALPGGGATVLAAGYGADRLAEITWSHGAATVSTRPILPGVASLAVSGDLLAFADPLLDAWVLSGLAPVPVPDSPSPPRSPASRVGEALFFTNLMAPWNKTEGRLSRFTCETCHFEGYVDGRVHHTGRGEVHAVTKPLLGLFNNRPYFSRALDPDLATMVNNEFRVAGALSDHDPWFSAADTGLAWVPLLGAPPEDLDALGLRRALMAFLMDFTPRPNPAALGRASFTDAERRGSAVFASRCERCHEARLVTDDPASRQPPERWEALVLSREGPLVWATSGYHKTGVVPYVHDEGARVPSLRRLYKKQPYFTSGSAKSVREVLDRVRASGEGFWHDQGAAGAERLSDEEKAALGAFLDLL